MADGATSTPEQQSPKGTAGGSAPQVRTDSPWGWVAGHIKEYVASDGERGYLWKGAPTLLITTVGRKTGIRRRTALIYGRDGDAHVVVASKGGAPDHPQWYQNLVADERVELQVGADVFPASARTASGEERARLWEMMAEIWPDYRTYQERTDREIPVVVLHRT